MICDPGERGKDQRAVGTGQFEDLPCGYSMSLSPDKAEVLLSIYAHKYSMLT